MRTAHLKKTSMEYLSAYVLQILSEDPNIYWRGDDLTREVLKRLDYTNANRVKAVIKTVCGTPCIRGSYGWMCYVQPEDVVGIQQLVDQKENQLQTMKDQLNSLQEEFNDKLAKVREQAEASGNRITEVQLKRGAKTVKVLKDIYHKEFRTLLDLGKARKNIFIYGPTGCGKSHVCKQLAKALDIPYYFISCTAGMSEGNVGGRNLPMQPNKDELLKTYKELIGQKIDKQAAALLASALSSGFGYVISEFVKAYENGGLFLLDEMDAADSNVLLFINAALANGSLAVPNRPHKPYAERHPDFVCVAAANTCGTGGDRMHSSRNKLDGATLDRFQIGKVLFGYDRELEMQVCLDSEGNFDKELAELLWKIRDAIDAHRLERVMSTRFIVEAVEMKHDFNWTHNQILKPFFTGWRQDEVRKVADHIGICITL